MEQKRIIFILAILIIAVNIYFYSNIKNDNKVSPSLNGIKAVKTLRLTVSTDVYKNSSLKYVLFYTNFWRNKNWHIGKETVGSEHHHFDNCSVKNCVFTNKKRYLKNYEDYDALIFHNGEGWKVNGKFCHIPEVRKPNQLYIIAVQE